jgi:hypothetical protein
MTKDEAIQLFNTASNLARAVGLTRSRISQWDDQLTQKQTDLVTGAAVRLGKLKPNGHPQKPSAMEAA